MLHHITAADSVDTPAGTPFIFAAVSDTLLVDANAFLISQSGGNVAVLVGSWTVTINGEVGTFGLYDGLQVQLNAPSDVTNVTVGTSGDVFGGSMGIEFKGVAIGKVTNLGTISGGVAGISSDASIASVTIVNSGLIQSLSVGLDLGFGTCTIINRGTIKGPAAAIFIAGETHLTNSGKIDGNVYSHNANDTFTDFQKIGKVIKSGTVSGMIDLGGGDDHFYGGNNNEKVQDGGGNDTYNFGGGNDYYIATGNGGAFIDTVNGGKGIDTYDASAATQSVSIYFNFGQAFGSNEIGVDNITGFETAIGGSGDDFLSGSNAANTLIGGVGSDHLTGLGGRDILTGGVDINVDYFSFTKLSDSGTKASTRDVITDFDRNDDLIDLQAIDANTKASGDQAFTFIGRANFTHTAGQLRESFSGGNTIVSGDVNGDGKADFSIELTGHFLMHDADFQL